MTNGFSLLRDQGLQYFFFFYIVGQKIIKLKPLCSRHNPHVDEMGIILSLVGFSVAVKKKKRGFINTYFYISINWLRTGIKNVFTAWTAWAS